jgi:hypothetical protein
MDRTQELIERNYWWPTINRDVREYVSGCETCQRTKANRHKQRAPLIPHDIPGRLWEVVSWDLIGPLSPSRGYDAIVVIVDKMGKRSILEPANVELTTEGAARIMLNRVFRNHGLPNQVISDRGPQFVSGFMRELYRLLGIEGKASTAWHPQTDGQTERMNQEIKQYLRVFVNHHQDDWADWLAIGEFALNDRVSSATGFSPFYLESGQHPWKGIEPLGESRNPNVNEFVRTLQGIRKEAEKNLTRAAEVMKKYHD